MGICIDLVIVLIFILNIFIGYKKGLINVIFSICAFLIAIIATLILYKPISNIIINNTNIDDKIKEVIVKNNTNNSNVETYDNGEKTGLQQYIESIIENTTEEAKLQATRTVADVISNKAVEILTGVVLFILIRIAVVLLKFLIEGIAELPIIKQFNQVGGIAYGILKSFIIIYLILTILFFVISIKGNTKIEDSIESSYITKFLYENNIIVNKLLPFR